MARGILAAALLVACFCCLSGAAAQAASPELLPEALESGPVDGSATTNDTGAAAEAMEKKAEVLPNYTEYEDLPTYGIHAQESSEPAPSDEEAEQLTAEAAEATASSSFGPEALAEEPEIFGLTGHNAYFGSEPDWEAVAHSGATVFRAEFNWYLLNTQGWAATFEKWVEQAAKHNITLLPYIVGRKTKEHNAWFYTSESGEWNEWLGYVK